MGITAKPPRPAAQRRCPAAALAAAILVTAFLQACGSTDPALSGYTGNHQQAVAYPPGRSTSGSVAPGAHYDMVGVASWYGRPYHGRRTASGEIYNMHRLTAAHRTLPFGTRVVVTNLDNGRSVVVTINDRGPFKGNRIIDVSQKAAGQLGFLNQGLTRVGVRVIESSRG